MKHKQEFFTVENPKNLERLIAAISACTHSTKLTADQLTKRGKLPKDLHDKAFNMEYYFFGKETPALQSTPTAKNCGTPACIAGHAMMLSGYNGTTYVFDPCEKLEEFLGIRYENASYLEMGDFSVRGLAGITVKETVDYLTALLKHNTQGN